MRVTISALFIGLSAALVAAPVPKSELNLPCFGGGPARNNANWNAKNLPAEFRPEIDEQKAINLLWKADLGSKSYSQPVVSGGLVLVGTNNERPRNPRDIFVNTEGEKEPRDKGVMMCFDVVTGKFLWQAVHDKLESGQVNDWPREGISSTPFIEEDRAYYMSNRCELCCVDMKGFANGNQGIKNEKYTDATDADFLWRVDLIKDYGVFPHNMSHSPPLVVGGVVYIITGNGVDDGHLKLPAPDAPSFMAFDKLTGKLLWKDNSPGKYIMHGQWSAPAYATAPVPQVIFPGGDGWLYAFEPKKGALLWKFDGNPKGTKYELGGSGNKSDFIAMPVIHDGRMYIGTGQDPEHFSGIANLWCLDLAKAVKYGKTNTGSDVSTVLNNSDPKAEVNQFSALEWHFGGIDDGVHSPRDFVFGRTMSNVLVVGDLLYACELAGYIHCLNAKTGKRYWVYDTKSTIWGTPLYADGRIYLGTEGGELFVFDHSAAHFALDTRVEMEKELTKRAANLRAKEVRSELVVRLNLKVIEFDAPIRSTPTAVGDVLYVTTEQSLYAFRKK